MGPVVTITVEMIDPTTEIGREPRPPSGLPQAFGLANGAPDFETDRIVAGLAAEPIAGGPRYGEPQLVRPRLGQGSFRLAVTAQAGASGEAGSRDSVG